MEGSRAVPLAAIVTIGDELLVGDRVDTNAAWLARRLTELGFSVHTIVSVGDEEGTIGDALGRAAEVAEVVVVTGGLGPTSDDRTREAVADRWGMPLKEDPELLERLRTRYARRGRDDLPPSARRLAQVPEGARALVNRRGSAAGLHLRVLASGGEADLLLLPGIPGEMRGLVEDGAGDVLRERYGPRLRPAPFFLLRTTGIPESELAERVESALRSTEGVEVAYRPSALGVEMRFAGRGPEGNESLRAFEERLRDMLEPYIYDHPSGDLAGAVGELLAGRGFTIAVAESCTGGLVLKRLTDIPGSSGWVLGGVVAYADRVKEEKLDVPASLLAEHGAVSEEVARAMAEGAARRFGTDVGLAVTGIAGPGGAVPGKPVGTVWLAVSAPGGTRAERTRFPGDRHEVRERASQRALHLLQRSLLAHREPSGGAPNSGPADG